MKPNFSELDARAEEARKYAESLEDEAGELMLQAHVLRLRAQNLRREALTSPAPSQSTAHPDPASSTEPPALQDCPFGE